MTAKNEKHEKKKGQGKQIRFTRHGERFRIQIIGQEMVIQLWINGQQNFVEQLHQMGKSTKKKKKTFFPF
jgi:hypothetical protein